MRLAAGVVQGRRWTVWVLALAAMVGPSCAGRSSSSDGSAGAGGGAGASGNTGVGGGSGAGGSKASPVGGSYGAVGSSGTVGSGGSGGECPGSVDTLNCDPLAALRRAKCTIDACHGTALPGGNLILASPCPEQRLVDVPATHSVLLYDGGPPPMCPAGALLIDTANPTASWMLLKLQDQQGSCGHGRNLSFSITSEDVACLTEWILALAGG